ncbi:MAG TPA: hypothetical protein VL261_01750 [Nitrospira sp.]|jgi:hypothetical protein|nr:hypothetical protein [Nitrospira sp.]
MQKMRSNHHYRGRIITLMPRMEGYMWGCHYVILRSGKTEIDGSPSSTYFSREEAEEAALAIAKRFIDQCHLDKDPLR